MTTPRVDQPIALVLSGGGIRAMVFHLGVLRALAERLLLERVKRLSTVSGGSLVVGLIFKEYALRWPSSSAFIIDVYPALRRKLCERSLQWGAARQLLRPMNLRFLLSRANLLAAALRHEWQVHEKLSALPPSPEWSINGTNAQNGRRFRFKAQSMGDYQTGYAVSNDFPLADALAVSAAFPGGFGPLSLKAEKYAWKKRAWNAPEESAEAVLPPQKTLHLYDGGVYDNLGLEPFFDAGRGHAKHADLFIILSDAGKPLPSTFSAGALNPHRLVRVADIMSDQSHALRVRTFVNYLQRDARHGIFVHIAESAAMSGDERAFATSFPTTLRRLETSEFDKIALHGYHLVKTAQTEQTR